MMAATAVRLTASPHFDDTMETSLDEFDRNQHSPALSIPSQHSGFRSSDASMSDREDEEVSNEPWSPPAWRGSAKQWYRHQPYPIERTRSSHSASASRSRETSHESYESAVGEDGDDTARPQDIPLPRTSESPAKEFPNSVVQKHSSSPDPFSGLGLAEDVAPITSPYDDRPEEGEAKDNCMAALQWSATIADSYLQISDLPSAQKSNSEPTRSRQS